MKESRHEVLERETIGLRYPVFESGEDRPSAGPVRAGEGCEVWSGHGLHGGEFHARLARFRRGQAVTITRHVLVKAHIEASSDTLSSEAGSRAGRIFAAGKDGPGCRIAGCRTQWPGKKRGYGNIGPAMFDNRNRHRCAMADWRPEDTGYGFTAEPPVSARGRWTGPSFARHGA